MLPLYEIWTDKFINKPLILAVKMEIRILRETKKEMLFEIEGAGHTFCGLLKEMLYKNSNVDAASYTIEHPLVGIPEFFVSTNGKESPKSALQKAVKSIKSRNSKMEKAISSAIK